MPKTAPTGCAVSAQQRSAASAAKTCPHMPAVRLGATAVPSRRARADVGRPAHRRASSMPKGAPAGLATRVPRHSVPSVGKTCPRRLTLTLGAAAVPSRRAKAGVDSPARRQSLNTTPKECPAGHAKDAQRSKGRHGSASAASAAARRSRLILRDATSRASLSRPALHEAPPEGQQRSANLDRRDERVKMQASVAIASLPLAFRQSVAQPASAGMQERGSARGPAVPILTATRKEQFQVNAGNACCCQPCGPRPSAMSRTTGSEAPQWPDSIQAIFHPFSIHFKILRFAGCTFSAKLARLRGQHPQHPPRL